MPGAVASLSSAWPSGKQSPRPDRSHKTRHIFAMTGSRKCSGGVVAMTDGRRLHRRTPRQLYRMNHTYRPAPNPQGESSIRGCPTVLGRPIGHAIRLGPRHLSRTRSASRLDAKRCHPDGSILFSHDHLSIDILQIKNSVENYCAPMGQAIQRTGSCSGRHCYRGCGRRGEPQFAGADPDQRVNRSEPERQADDGSQGTDRSGDVGIGDGEVRHGQNP